METETEVVYVFLTSVMWLTFLANHEASDDYRSWLDLIIHRDSLLDTLERYADRSYYVIELGSTMLKTELFEYSYSDTCAKKQLKEH